VDRYSFPVRIFHSLLHAGLPRRTNIATALKMPWAGVRVCIRTFPRGSTIPLSP
jgi:hypothetical protein